ncbi:hypothetical protein FIBSPDRAFT_1047683 [Athelia psychrophila]|uniref:Uncharacterized protein n=1 Tax=Athelia psychrophila TaxID=1759441 RepID=A0A166EWU9_9AGAM|nr:hypothetical protein FIBSPDRAFT_1047683 [Fibularhizoctonia sp. CBS 109695]
MSFTYAHLPPVQPVRPCDRPHARAVFAVSDNPSAYAVIRPVEAAVVDTYAAWSYGHLVQRGPSPAPQASSLSQSSAVNFSSWSIARFAKTVQPFLASSRQPTARCAAPPFRLSTRLVSTPTQLRVTNALCRCRRQSSQASSPTRVVLTIIEREGTLCNEWGMGNGLATRDWMDGGGYHPTGRPGRYPNDAHTNKYNAPRSPAHELTPIPCQITSARAFSAQRSTPTEQFLKDRGRIP